MPIKCESCRHYVFEQGAIDAVCQSPQIDAEIDPNSDNFFAPILMIARDYCDREGDGIFVYFEPKDPTTGAAFATATSPTSPTTPEMALKAAA